MEYKIFTMNKIIVILFLLTSSLFSLDAQQKLYFELDQDKAQIAGASVPFNVFLTEGFPYHFIDRDQLIKITLEDQNDSKLSEQIFHVVEGVVSDHIDIPYGFKSGLYTVTAALLDNTSLSMSYNIPLIDFNDFSQGYFELKSALEVEGPCSISISVEEYMLKLISDQLKDQIISIKILDEKQQVIHQKSMMATDSILTYDLAEFKNKSLLTIEIYDGNQVLIAKDKVFLDLSDNFEVFEQIKPENKLAFLKSLEYSNSYQEGCISKWPVFPSLKEKIFRVEGNVSAVDLSQQYFITFSIDGTNVKYTRVDENGHFLLDSIYIREQSSLRVDLIDAKNLHRIQDFKYSIEYSPFIIENKATGFNPLPLPLELERKVDTLKRQLVNIFYSAKGKTSSLPQSKPGPTYYLSEPDESYEVSEYTEYSTMAETIKELVGKKKMRRKNGSSVIYLMNRFNNMFFDRPPLIIVNSTVGVSIQDLMETNPRNVKSIDVYYNTSQNLSSFGELSTYGIIWIKTNNDQSNYVSILGI